MAIPFSDTFESLRDRFERLSQRERTLVAAFVVTFFVMLTLIVGFLIVDGLASLEQNNADMRQALSDIDTKRDAYLKAKAKLAQVESRLAPGQMQLGSYLEAAAKEAGVEIPESKENRPTTAGSFLERSTDLHLTKVKVEALSNFLRRIETGAQLVVVTQLTIRTRDDKHQELDVDLTVSSWEKAVEKKDKDGNKDKDGKDGNKDGKEKG